jgi:hypothetical protein
MGAGKVFIGAETRNPTFVGLMSKDERYVATVWNLVATNP